jgi:hypothetical protein
MVNAEVLKFCSAHNEVSSSPWISKGTYYTSWSNFILGMSDIPKRKHKKPTKKVSLSLCLMYNLGS